MLQTRKVFIDTQSFVKAGLHFEGPAFKSFRKYCEANELFHVSTSVVEREVKTKIETSVKEAIGAIQTFRRKARLLSSLDDHKIKGLFEEIPDEDIFKNSVDVFEEYLNACSTVMIESNSVNAEELLSLYFEKKPPFGDGKKKAEFPDAISILSLKKHMKDDEKIYIVSNDGDMKAYCAGDAQFISVDSLDKLLDIYTTHISLRHEQVKQYFVANEASMKQKIKALLEDCDVYNSSTWDDAKVDDGLTVTYLGSIEPSVLYIDDEESQITFDIDLEFEVTVTGPNFNSGKYDREYGRVLTFDSTTKTSAILTTFTVEVLLHYEFIDGELINAEVDNLYVGDTFGGIEVEVEEND